MSSQPLYFPQFHPSEVATHIDGPAIGYFVPIVYDDDVLMGNMIYDYLVREENATLGQHFPGLPDSPSFFWNTYGVTDVVSPPSSPANYATSNTADDLSFPLSPTPPSSETSSSPDSSPTPDTYCNWASPVRIRGKWYCGACKKRFRGKWECGRHIGYVGKRAKCPACGKDLSVRSLKRHLEDFCKENIDGLTIEDILVEGWIV